MGKLLSLGARLRYPVTITKLLKRNGDAIKKQESVLEYSFKWMKEMGDHVSGETWQEEQTTIASWDSPVDGTLKGWRLREGDAVHKDMTCMEVDEACSHEMQYHGMCAFCGEDMTEVNWASDQANTHRATVNMTHDQTGLMVSNELATRAEHEAQRRLLGQRKLSLVVDLDQTIIHACIEPTVGEWMNDPTNPNYDAVKDVRKFQLNDEGPRGPVTSTCWYYIKMRPGLKEFLEKVAELYELHVYTMGTRAYALNIAKIVDPQQKLFGNRVISRDESGSMIAKDLQRLFPASTNMVVIIDDRADVWPRNRPNLIKVVPYDFFKGIGDINSSFLPKRRDILPAPEAPKSKTAASSENNASAPAPKPSAMAELASMNTTDEKQLKKQAEEQEKTLELQLKERPLLHAQEALEKENEEKIKEDSPDGAESEAEIDTRAQVLRDDDLELEYLQQHLTELHSNFYQVYDDNRNSRRDSPPKQAPSHDKPRRKSEDDGVDLSMVPDVGEVLDDLKAKVLQDTVIVLSGLVPLGIDVTQSDIGLQAMSHGAEIQTKVSKKVTHLVVSTARLNIKTQKATQAARIPSIKIVNQNWLLDSISQWKHLDEEPYLEHVSTGERRNGSTEDNAQQDDQGLQIFTDKFGNEEDESVDDGDDEDEENQERSISPIDNNLDWDALNDEMNEFLNGTDDESQSDNESVSQASMLDDATDDERSSTNSGVKRKADDDEGDGSALAKRQRLAKDRGASKLSSARIPGEDAESSSLPTPQITDGDGDGEVDAQEGDGMDDLEAELEAALEREMEAAD